MRYAALDGWRGVAAIVVCLYHLSVFGNFYELSFIRNGGYFVEFFFVLSGFVLAHAYVGSIRDRASLLAFFVKRVGRLWPLHLFTLAVLVFNEGVKWGLLRYTGLHAGAAAFADATSFEALLLNVVLLHGLGTYTDPTWNVPSWSISAEFVTYLLFGLVCYRVRAQLARTTLCIALAAGAAAALVLHGLHADWLRVTFLICVLEFFLGVVTYAVFDRLRDRVRLPWGILEIVALALVIFSFRFSWLREYVFLLPLLFAATIFVFAFEAGPISRLLCTRPIQYLGLISYSIYMVHFVVLTGLNSGTRAASQVMHSALRATIQTPGGPVDVLVLGPPWVGDLVALAYLAVVLGAATWTFRFVELPGQTPFNALAERIRRGGRVSLGARVGSSPIGRGDGAAFSPQRK